jgi:hypothetical protein
MWSLGRFGDSLAVVNAIARLLPEFLAFEVAQRALSGSTRNLRAKLADRLEDVDTKAIRRQLNTLSEQLAALTTVAIETVEDRVRPERKRRRRVVRGVVLVGLVAAVGYGLFELGRRGALQQVARRMPLGGAIPGLSSNGAIGEAALRTAVEAAIRAGNDAPELTVEVEGRTVYLRGTAPDRGALERALERAQNVPGVAAVVNLASVPATTV